LPPSFTRNSSIRCGRFSITKGLLPRYSMRRPSLILIWHTSLAGAETYFEHAGKPVQPLSSISRLSLSMSSTRLRNPQLIWPLSYVQLPFAQQPALAWRNIKYLFPRHSFNVFGITVAYGVRFPITHYIGNRCVKPELINTSLTIPCATASQRLYWNPVTTFARYGNCWATVMCKPP
jgi:hypothetical protein